MTFFPWFVRLTAGTRRENISPSGHSGRAAFSAFRTLSAVWGLPEAEEIAASLSTVAISAWVLLAEHARLRGHRCLKIYTGFPSKEDKRRMSAWYLKSNWEERVEAAREFEKPELRQLALRTIHVNAPEALSPDVRAACAAVRAEQRHGLRLDVPWHTVGKLMAELDEMLQSVLQDYEPTPGQAEAIRELGPFLDGDEHDVFLLRGHAGTGKTFLIDVLARSLSRKGRAFHLSAPTVRAARVITVRPGGRRRPSTA
jgi:hypothetical protein